MEIKHLKHHEIDIQKWDHSILNAHNSLVYAESWYLNIVSPTWEALILGDYEFVMPLPVKKKYGISFLVQPPLTQQLGIFSAHNIEEDMPERFIKKIPYLSYHLCFNEKNYCNKGIKKPNYGLNLNRDYEALFSDYANNTKRNIKKASSYNVEIKTDILADEFLKFYNTTEKNYREPEEKVNALVKESFEKNKITIYGAYHTDNTLISVLCLLHSGRRLIYWLPVSNKEGKETLAMFSIVDKIIKNYANSNFFLDFSGSTVSTISRFYESFGAEKHLYNEIKYLSINDFIKRFCFWKP